MKTRLPWLLLGWLLVGGLLLRAAEPALRTFESATLARVRSEQKGRPFVVVFWSVTCEPCRDELALLASLGRRYPAVRVLLVAADGPERRSAVLRTLAAYDLAGIELWQFGDEPGERIRYAVDRTWRGELPRTYFHDSSHQVTAFTGCVTPDELEIWLASASPKATVTPAP
jgi:thiol-disulfide isomerase/thioredoxin